jgi:hypothetical protein
VPKSYSQVEVLDFDKFFALVARLELIRILHTYVTHHDFNLYQMDINNAFFECANQGRSVCGAITWL